LRAREIRNECVLPWDSLPLYITTFFEARGYEAAGGTAVSNLHGALSFYKKQQWANCAAYVLHGNDSCAVQCRQRSTTRTVNEFQMRCWSIGAIVSSMWQQLLADDDQ
jgi:hypothetical protein